MWIWLKISLLSNPCVTGIEHAYVHVHRNNTPAQKLYEKMGFEVIPSELLICASSFNEHEILTKPLHSLSDC
jgi:hypothetical protein